MMLIPCARCDKEIQTVDHRTDGRLCDDCITKANPKLLQLTDEDRSYIGQMEAWLKEQEAREKQIRVTIETSSEIVKQNEILLSWHLKNHEAAVKEFEQWKLNKGIK